MNRIGIKRALVVSILGYILISWYLLKFVEPPVSAELIIAIFTPFFAVFAGGVNKMVDILFENNRISLRCKLDEIIKYSFNNDKQSPLIDNSIKLINGPKYPRKIERKIAEYNKKAEDLIALYFGCDYLVRDMITKNVLMYLSEINVLRDEQWEMTGYGGEQRLSDLLYSVLKDGIINGDKIDKTFFDSVDSRFHVKILQHTSAENFENFLRHLTDGITYHRKYGCLKLFAQLYKEVKEHAEELRSDKYVKKRWR